MPNSYRSVLVASVLVFAASVGPAIAWDQGTTHRDLSKIAANNSVLDSGYLSVLGIKDGFDAKLTWSGGQLGPVQAVEDWIQEGAQYEDGVSILFDQRYRNHFHNPLEPWPSAGLNDDLVTGQSALLWAQNAQNNPSWSWPGVRLIYYLALITTVKADRDAYLAQMFAGIGHLIHLIQDMSQPSHVRNDIHIDDALGIKERMENWASANQALARGFMTPPDLPSKFPTIPPEQFLRSAESATPPYVPITAFWDTNVFTKDSTAAPTGTDVGLAEYTNGNFFSDDTINATGNHYFRFPSPDPANYSLCIDPSPTWLPGVKRKYISRQPCDENGEPLDHFAAASLLYNPNNPNPDRFFLNDEVYVDYARDLLPRAVGYSAAFIDYFFRDDIEITPPQRVVYGLTAPGGVFQEIKLKAKATTTTGDALTDGQISLVVVYRPALEDPYRANLSAMVQRGEFVSIVVPEKNGLRAIPADTPVELTFDLGNTPLPLLATDVHFQVVYHGAIGTWTNAVAVGAKDLSEPTPIDLINTMDYSCLNGNYVVSGSPEAVALAAGNPSWDIYPHRMANVYVKFSSEASPQLASPTLYDAFLPTLNPATYGRIFILVDSRVYWSSHAQIVSLDGRDGATHLGTYTVLLLASGLINQTDVINGQATGFYAGLSLVRGVPFWYGAYYPNQRYPSGTVCADHVIRSAQPNATGPVAVQFP